VCDAQIPDTTPPQRLIVTIKRCFVFSGQTRLAGICITNNALIGATHPFDRFNDSAVHFDVHSSGATMQLMLDSAT
jgi:hypothetical protein